MMIGYSTPSKLFSCSSALRSGSAIARDFLHLGKVVIDEMPAPYTERNKMEKNERNLTTHSGAQLALMSG
jgi:hypothetical protein